MQPLPASNSSSFIGSGYSHNTFEQNFDTNALRHVGWDSNIEEQANYQVLWDQQRLINVQNKITELLQGVADNNRPILVPIETIAHVLNQVYSSRRPMVGSIFSRYIQETPENDRNDVREMYDRTINIIVSQIRNEYEMIANNRKLTVWNALYGDFNTQGLRAHAPIKLRHRRPNPALGLGAGRY